MTLLRIGPNSTLQNRLLRWESPSLINIYWGHLATLKSEPLKISKTLKTCCSLRLSNISLQLCYVHIWVWIAILAFLINDGYVLGSTSRHYFQGFDDKENNICCNVLFMAFYFWLERNAYIFKGVSSPLT
jgi:hypothetical protein